MPTTTLSSFPFYTFERRQQASKGNTISKLNQSNTNIMTAIIFLVIIDNLLLTLAVQLPMFLLSARPVTDVDVVAVVVVGDALGQKQFQAQPLW